jgi:hypothetical protein
VRTSLWDIVRLAWVLWRHPYREQLRIGQIIENAVSRAETSPGVRVFYVENRMMVEYIKRARHFWLKQIA